MKCTILFYQFEIYFSLKQQIGDWSMILIMEWQIENLNNSLTIYALRHLMIHVDWRFICLVLEIERGIEDVVNPKL